MNKRAGHQMRLHYFETITCMKRLVFSPASGAFGCILVGVDYNKTRGG
jgi:hypothetical protein